MKILRINILSILVALVAFFAMTSCTPGTQQLTPAMQEYRLSEIMKELEHLNTEGIISSLSSDDSTLIVTISDEWQAASIEQQNHALEVLGSTWLSISEKIGVKEPLLHRLQVVAMDRFHQKRARWTLKGGVQR